MALSGMKIIYSDQTLEFDKPSIMLCGPTPRSISVKSWRPDAIKILQDLNFDGIVFVPETTTNTYDFMSQVEWEYEAITKCSILVFWIPRNLETLPGLTTNVEFGKYAKYALYGRPPGSVKNDYLDWFYKKETGRYPYNNLTELLVEAVTRAKT